MICTGRSTGGDADAGMDRDTGRVGVRVRFLALHWSIRPRSVLPCECRHCQVSVSVSVSVRVRGVLGSVSVSGLGEF